MCAGWGDSAPTPPLLPCLQQAYPVPPPPMQQQQHGAQLAYPPDRTSLAFASLPGYTQAASMPPGGMMPGGLMMPIGMQPQLAYMQQQQHELQQVQALRFSAPPHFAAYGGDGGAHAAAALAAVLAAHSPSASDGRLSLDVGGGRLSLGAGAGAAEWASMPAGTRSPFSTLEPPHSLTAAHPAATGPSKTLTAALLQSHGSRSSRGSSSPDLDAAATANCRPTMWQLQQQQQSELLAGSGEAGSQWHAAQQAAAVAGLS